MIDKSIYKEFYDYLTEGANHIIQNNRDNLENYIRESIDINKSSDILKKYMKKNDNFIVSPKTFLSLCLIDDLPKNIDLRFTPEFKLDGIIFKNQRTRDIVTSTKVFYSEKINNFLKLQISPNSDVEMSRSAKYSDNIINNLTLFDKLFREEIESYKNSVFRKINKLLNITNPFFDSIVSCVINKDNCYSSRISSHHTHTFKHQLKFCSQFNAHVNSLDIEVDKINNVDPLIIYKIIYNIVLSSTFPKLSDLEKEMIFKISLNMDIEINYHTISEIIKTKYDIHPLLCGILENSKKERAANNEYGELFLNYNECFSKKSIEVLNDSHFNTIISHNFFNLILFINRCREQINYNLKKKLPILNNEIILNISLNIQKLNELSEWIKNNSNTNINLKYLHPKFREYLNQSKILDGLDGKINLEFNIEKKTIERFLKSLYPHIPIYGRRVKNDSLVSKTIRKKDEYNDSNSRDYSKKFKDIINNNNFIIEFCKNENAWNEDDSDNKLYEITSGNILSNVNKIGCKNLLSYLFKEQVDVDFFKSVQYILFHENLIVVSKNGELSSLYPSDGYKQFVLKNISSPFETSRIDNDDNIQLDRFNKILDNVLNENEKIHFDDQNGDSFIYNISDIFNIKFIKTIDSINSKKEKEQHELSWGSISKIEQEYFTDFLKDFSFIFPSKISEIHLSNVLPKKRTEIPLNEKELFFYIEKQKDDRDMYDKYFITQEDLILLSRSNMFYTTILVDRAFCVIFNREILNNEIMYAEFKNVVGQKNIEIAERYFKVRGKSITDHRLLRKIFIKNSSLFIQNKKEELSIQIVDFMSNIFRQKKQLY